MPAARSFAVALLLSLAAPLHAQTPLLPTGLAYDTTGNLYFTDTNRHQVFEATLAGKLVLIAGSGTQGYAGDNGPATVAQLNSPQAITITPDGTLYIADTGNNVIRAVSVAGTITTFAAALNTPNALVIDTTGALLVCDSANHRIRRISNGVITTIAGNGIQGFSGDGAAATAAQLDTPSGIAIAPDGRIFIADTHNHRIRVIATNGTITTYAGTDTAGFSGDNTAAISAQLSSPRGLAITATGALLIADADNQRIRSISPQGIITTLAGTAIQGSITDSTPATTATINTPQALAITSFDYAAFSDTANQTLRVLASDGKLYVPAALSTGRQTTVTLTAATTLAVSVTGSVATPQGTVQLLIDNVPTATATLISGTATFPLIPGTHTLSANYTGDGLNPAATSAPITVTNGLSPSTIVMQTPAQNSYAGLPLLLNAYVTSSSSRSPTGAVTFSEGGSVITTVQLAAGIASGVYLSPTAGAHTLVATYAGDASFTPSTTPPVTVVVRPVPDFSIASSGNSKQTIVAGAIATYTLSVAPVTDAFNGAVSLSVTGLPKGATATFAPPQVIPGPSSVTSTLTIQTVATKAHVTAPDRSFYALFIFPFLILLMKDRKRAATALMLTLICITGCGTRINELPSPSSAGYTLTVTATGTSVTGSLLTHTTTLTLNVQ